jgi:hypothetical protein
MGQERRATVIYKKDIDKLSEVCDQLIVHPQGITARVEVGGGSVQLTRIMPIDIERSYTAPADEVRGAVSRGSLYPSKVEGEPCDAPTFLGTANPLEYDDNSATLAALRWVSGAVSRDRGRANLCSILCEGDRLIATDGHQLRIAPIKGVEFKGQIPCPGLDTILECVAGGNIAWHEGGIRINGPGRPYWRVDWTPMSPEGDHRFPPYQKILPPWHTTGCTNPNGVAVTLTSGDAVELSSVLQDLDDLISCPVYAVLGFEEKGLVVKGRPRTKTRWDVNGPTLPAKVEGLESELAGQEIGVNPSYLADMLEGATNQVTLSFTGALEAIVIETGDRYGIVMPIRL